VCSGCVAARSSPTGGAVAHLWVHAHPVDYQWPCRRAQLSASLLGRLPFSSSSSPVSRIWSWRWTPMTRSVTSLLTATQARGVRSAAVRLRRTVAMQDDRSLDHQLALADAPPGSSPVEAGGHLRQVNVTTRTRLCPRHPTGIRHWLPDSPGHVLITARLHVWTEWTTTSARVRSRSPPSTLHPRSASSGRTSPTARVIVERDRAGHSGPAGQHVMGDPVAPEHRGGQQPVDEHPVPGTASDRPLVRPIGQSRVLTRLPARPQLGDQLSQDREGQSGPPGDWRQRRHGPGSSTPRPCSVGNESFPVVAGPGR
jgi:hypothetical protein